ncbi:MAG: hypothetical protein GF317_11355 [Candidatus Lokiarchaeota archaeon]|nr:hypothetical protein [Candidatus Lokiarchaeota archaeon]MBD3200246.1 hypothetical protein [Candidatus Lokiarchaeota archaeon]
MIFQGLFNILDLYFDETEQFYDNIDQYFRKNINNIGFSKKEIDSILKDLIFFTTNQFIELGFTREEIENKFSDPFLEITDNDKQRIESIREIYKSKVAPIVYELFLEKVVDYLADNHVAPLVLKLKSQGLMPFEMIMKLKELKNLLEKNPEKLENLRRYIHIREKIIGKFSSNKCQIEELEDIKDPQDKLQLVYMIYRIIDFFHLTRIFDFSHIKLYLKNNLDEWLTSVPLVTLKNPDLYFCGLYLATHLNVEINEEKVKEFLLELYGENIDEFEAPIIEATDQIYYLFKSLKLIDLHISDEKLRNLINADASYFEKQYLKNLETSQLVVILKIYNLFDNVGRLDKSKTIEILEEIEQRITPEGILQYRDGIISAEATYYVLFCFYMRGNLERLKEFDILDTIISRIYRNLEIIDFCRNTNYDLVSEIFYSCESLKLLNCIETKEMIYHLAKYLFPEEIVENGLLQKEINREKARFRHLKVNRTTGETVY